MSTLIRTISRFRRDRSGNIAMIFGLALLPLLIAVGCAVDYSRANQIRSKLISAADAASVGSISKASPGFIAAGAMTSDGEISAGEADARKIFNGNIANQNGFTLTGVTPTMTKSGGTITSTVQFTADVPTMFLGVMGRSKVSVSGTSTSTANMPLYIDFYLLLDNSPSMGVGHADGRRRPGQGHHRQQLQAERPMRLRLPRLQRPQQLLQSGEIAWRDDADRRASQCDPAIDGYRGGDPDLFEPVPHGDL